MQKETTKEYSLSVFFPFYNEEENIRPVVEKAINVLDNLKLSNYEIIMVDDGSKDGTKQIAEELVKKYPRLKLVAHKKNQGYGAALISGFRAATGDYVFFSDGDSQFDFVEIKKLLRHIPECDVVIGYRSPRHDSPVRLLNAWGWNVLNRIFFGLKVKDIDCAFKLFKRELVLDLPIISGGAMVTAEMLIRLKEKGVFFKEVPVSHFPRRQGEATGASWKVIFRAFKEFYQFYKQDKFGGGL
jgi:glycosyltransferase involved in cell wall biosynthesis